MGECTRADGVAGRGTLYRYVHGFAYRGLKNFASSFDYTSECWKRFYAARDAEAAKQKAEEEAKAAAARAQADDEASNQVGGTKVTAPDATARAKVGSRALLECCHRVLAGRLRTHPHL